MKNYTDSDYALNKFSKGIVYRFADGASEVTMEAYLNENPEKTEMDFLELKSLSDEMYLEQVQDDWRQTSKNVPLHGLEETDSCAVCSPEESLVDQPEQDAQNESRRKLGLQAFGTLTTVQKRRYRMYHVDGMTLMEVAEKEGVKFQSVADCINAAERKIQKYLKKLQKHPEKTLFFSH